jgi:hypothetical protein
MALGMVFFLISGSAVLACEGGQCGETDTYLEGEAVVSGQLPKDGEKTYNLVTVDSAAKFAGNTDCPDPVGHANIDVDIVRITDVSDPYKASAFAQQRQIIGVDGPRDITLTLNARGEQVSVSEIDKENILVQAGSKAALSAEGKDSAKCAGDCTPKNINADIVITTNTNLNASRYKDDFIDTVSTNADTKWTMRGVVNAPEGAKIEGEGINEIASNSSVNLGSGLAKSQGYLLQVTPVCGGNSVDAEGSGNITTNNSVTQNGSNGLTIHSGVVINAKTKFK